MVKFQLYALESIGPVCSQALFFLYELGQRMSAVSGDIRETAHPFQRLSMTMQHFKLGGSAHCCLDVKPSLL